MRKRNYLKTSSYIVIIAVLIGAFILITALNNNHFNDGICPDCHQEYETREFISDGDSYIKFECDKCNRVGRIRTETIY